MPNDQAPRSLDDYAWFAIDRVVSPMDGTLLRVRDRQYAVCHARYVDGHWRFVETVSFSPTYWSPLPPDYDGEQKPMKLDHASVSEDGILSLTFGDVTYKDVRIMDINISGEPVEGRLWSMSFGKIL